MRLYTCQSGLELMKMGCTFGAWDIKTEDALEYPIEVPEGAAIKEDYDEEGGYTTYSVISPDLCSAVEE
ncbi:hypothetical protein D3C76_1422620 [compost metagenome]